MKKRVRLDFKIKIILTNIIILIIFACILFYYFYTYVIDEENEKAADDLYNTSAVIAKQIDNVFYNMDKIGLQIASNPYILNIFSQIQPEEENFFKNDSVFNYSIVTMLNSYNLKQNTSARICLYNEYEDFVYCGVRLVSESALDNFFENGLFKNIETSFEESKNQYALFIPPREDPFDDDPESEKVFSVVRQLKDYTLLGSQACGYAEVQMSLSALEDIFSDLPEGLEGYISDAEGNVIYCTDSDIPLWNSEKGGEVEEGGYEEAGYLINRIKCENFDLNLTMVQNKEYVVSLMQFWTILLVVLGLFLTVLCVIEWLAVRHITKPLAELKKSVDAVRIDNLSWELVQQDGNNDLEQLNMAFQRMVEKLQTAIDMLVESQTSTLKAQLLALQAQMDPHFMHNILTIIAMCAEEGQTDQISEICMKLSFMLRYTADYQSGMVPLEEEFSYVEKYLELMKIRYESHLLYEINQESDLSAMEIPKLTVQPLVENCFKHGFKGIRPPWKIKVEGYSEGNFWWVKVEDNGMGFDPEKLETFREFVKGFDPGNTKNKLDHMKIGELCLTNIYIRLRIRFGENIRFQIYSDEQNKTIIKFGGPK